MKPKTKPKKEEVKKSPERTEKDLMMERLARGEKSKVRPIHV